MQGRNHSSISGPSALACGAKSIRASTWAGPEMAPPTAALSYWFLMLYIHRFTGLPRLTLATLAMTEAVSSVLDVGSTACCSLQQIHERAVLVTALPRCDRAQRGDHHDAALQGKMRCCGAAFVIAAAMAYAGAHSTMRRPHDLLSDCLETPRPELHTCSDSKQPSEDRLLTHARGQRHRVHPGGDRVAAPRRGSAASTS